MRGGRVGVDAVIFIGFVQDVVELGGLATCARGFQDGRIGGNSEGLWVTGWSGAHGRVCYGRTRRDPLKRVVRDCAAR